MAGTYRKCLSCGTRIPYTRHYCDSKQCRAYLKMVEIYRSLKPTTTQEVRSNLSPNAVEPTRGHPSRTGGGF